MILDFKKQKSIIENPFKKNERIYLLLKDVKRIKQETGFMPFL